MTKRIPESSIVSSPKRVLPAGHPDLFWYDPSKVIIVGEDLGYSSTGSVVFVGSDITNGSLTPDPPKGKDGEKDSDTSDVPQLSDIEDVLFTKYFDPVSKIEKAKVVIKIRNSSKNKENVAGVDARIYQPRGI